eukprot:TRINITY_DN590_c0_g1_i1.p1 TRINITY_DN590_c0_g1~~TRINITY_DN590_c0_g1_i1.p1  ORF type:complete len:709 (+),score=58.99 TRINITY_DN590_c0_g1_i1:99-2129(+)
MKKLITGLNCECCGQSMNDLWQLCPFCGTERSNLAGSRIYVPGGCVGEFSPSDIIHTVKLSNEGIFGEIWAGKLFQQDVVFKYPKLNISRDEHTRQWVTEALILSQCPSPYVVQYLGFCRVQRGDKDALVLAFERMDGDLESLLGTKTSSSNSTHVPLSERVGFCVDIAKGLAHLFARNVVHRDLKLENILYKKLRDGSYRIKIADFGLSTRLKRISKRCAMEEDPSSEEGGFAIPNSKTRKRRNPYGNLAASPPEVFAIANDVEECYGRSGDIYAFGICMWSLLSLKDVDDEEWGSYGKQPYDNFKQAVLKGGRPKLSRIPNVLNLRELVKSCWSFDPASVPLSAQPQRPLWADIIEKLEKIKVKCAHTFDLVELIDSTISGAEGREFWKKNFVEQDDVNWPDFIDRFFAFLGVEEEFPQDFHQSFCSFYNSMSCVDGYPVAITGWERNYYNLFLLFRMLSQTGRSFTSAAHSRRVHIQSLHNVVISMARFNLLIQWFRPTSFFADLTFFIRKHGKRFYHFETDAFKDLLFASNGEYVLQFDMVTPNSSAGSRARLGGGYLLSFKDCDGFYGSIVLKRDRNGKFVFKPPGYTGKPMDVDRPLTVQRRSLSRGLKICSSLDDVIEYLQDKGVLRKRSCETKANDRELQLRSQVHTNPGAKGLPVLGMWTRNFPWAE